MDGSGKCFFKEVQIFDVDDLTEGLNLKKMTCSDAVTAVKRHCSVFCLITGSFLGGFLLLTDMFGVT